MLREVLTRKESAVQSVGKTVFLEFPAALKLYVLNFIFSDSTLAMP